MLNTLKLYDPYAAMPLEDIAARFPTLRATRPHESRSERFAHIGTLDILQGLVADGFQVHGVQVARVNGGHHGYEKHLIRLRKYDQPRIVGDVYPEILLRNAHDGTSAYELSAGMMRLVCLNGLVVSKSWGAVRVPHVGKKAIAKVIDATHTVMESFGRVAGAIEQFRATEMSDDDQHAFAAQAFALRYQPDAETGTTRAPVTPYAMLHVRRMGDQGNDLWQVFNRVQENLVRGGQAGRVVGNNGRMRRASTRAVTGIDQSLSINRRLFGLAEQWAQNKGAARVAELAAFAA